MRITTILLLAVVGGVALGSGLAAWSFYRFPDQESIELGLVAQERDLAEKHSSVEIEEAEYDFGSMDGHDVGNHDFIFRNVGEAPLELEAGATTCKCTLSDVADGVIAPGESGIVSLEWNGKGNLGPFTQTATIITNDPENPTVSLQIHGHMLAKTRLVPDHLVLSSVPAGQPGRASLQLFGYEDKPLEVTGYETDDHQDVELSFSPLPSDEVKGEEYATCGQRIDLTLKPGLPPGPFKRRIRVKTNVEGMEEIVIPVTGKVSSEISVFGPGWIDSAGVLRLGTVGDAKTVRRLWIKVGGLHPDEIRFEVAEVQPEFVIVRLGERTTPPGSRVAVIPIEIEIPEGSPPCNYLGPKMEKLGRIRLTTNHPTVKELDIYLRFLISG